MGSKPSYNFYTNDLLGHVESSTRERPRDARNILKTEASNLVERVAQVAKCGWVLRKGKDLCPNCDKLEAKP